MTQFPELFAALGARFGTDEIRERTQAGRQLKYVTARTVMNRLDTVLGPENWWDDYQPGENSVVCRLTIRLPDDSTVTKADAGGYAGMSDQGDDDKSGYSDAFKRAAVKFGVGRYLYRDGVPTFERMVTKETLALPGPAAPPAVDNDPAPVGPAAFRDWLKTQKDSPLDPWPALSKWAAEQRYPERLGRWTPLQVERGYREAKRLIREAKAAQESFA